MLRHKLRRYGPRVFPKPPRLGTGRPPNASVTIAETLARFCDLYSISLNAFGRHTRISPWSIRQAKAGKRSLRRTSESLIKATMERLQSGKLWLRRISKQRCELEWINPPYKPHCPTGALYCTGGLLPASCPKRWKECLMNCTDWEIVERSHSEWTQTQKESGQTQAGG